MSSPRPKPAGTRPSPWPFPLLQGTVLLSQCMALTHPLPSLAAATMAQPRASQQQTSPSSLGGWYKAPVCPWEAQSARAMLVANPRPRYK